VIVSVNNPPFWSPWLVPWPGLSTPAECTAAGTRLALVRCSPGDIRGQRHSGDPRCMEVVVGGVCAAGSLSEAMSEGIEQSTVVLVCCSRDYKHSINCQSGLYIHDLTLDLSSSSSAGTSGDELSSFPSVAGRSLYTHPCKSDIM